MSSGYNGPRPVFEETSGSKAVRKFQENPMVPIGMAGFFAAVVYGVRNYKKRPQKMTLSMYIMRFRVFAQSIAVGAMGVGIGYSILKEKFFKSPEENDNKTQSR